MLLQGARVAEGEKGHTIWHDQVDRTVIRDGVRTHSMVYPAKRRSTYGGS